MRARSGVVTVIYAKSLVLANNGESRASGDIVNLMSVDATRLQDFCQYGLMAISGPLQVKLTIFIYYFFSTELPRLLWPLSLCIIFLDGPHLLG